MQGRLSPVDGGAIEEDREVEVGVEARASENGIAAVAAAAYTRRWVMRGMR